MRILYVDDSPAARAAAQRAMTAQGLDVTVASSLAEASQVDAASIGAALLDLELGSDLGTDVASRLRRASPSLPIAFLTAAMNGDLLAAARAFGPVFDKTRGLEAALQWLSTLL